MSWKKAMNPKYFLIPSLVLSIFVYSGYARVRGTCRNAVLTEVRKYPKLEIQDIYKLVYQAAMGNEHIMADTVLVKKFLKEELNSIEASADEPLIEYLTSDSTIARINLRPFKAQKGNPDILITLMIKTAMSIKPSVEYLRFLWQDIEDLAVEKRISFSKDDLHSYFQEIEQQKFPAVHHSQAVKEAYHPAYRVISGKLITMDQLR
jgi:hypothetical protein